MRVNLGIKISNTSITSQYSTIHCTDSSTATATMLYSSNGIKHERPYLHPWNNLLQNAVQTSSPLWQAQRPVDPTQTQEKIVVMGLFTSTTVYRQNAADDYEIQHRLSHHAGCAPYVGRRAVSGADEHLQGPVLPCLDVFGKVLVLKAKHRENNHCIQWASHQQTERWVSILGVWWHWMCLWLRVPNQEIPRVIRRLLTTQQAFPKSAILTLMLSALSGSRGLTSRDPAVGLPIAGPKREREIKSQ